MKTTKIEWCDSTANPTVGCDGCELYEAGVGGTCYAAAIHTRFCGSPAYPEPFGVVETRPGRMIKAAAWSDLGGVDRPKKPWLNQRPRHIFIGDMGDTLSRAIDFDYLRDEVIANVISRNGRRHVWLWLTKRPTRMAEFSVWLEAEGLTWPWNLVAMTSVTDQATAEARLPALVEVCSLLHGVSLEPLLGPVDVTPWLGELDWLIVAGESGSRARPMNPAWVRAIRDRRGDVPFFFKSWGAWLPIEQADGIPKASKPIVVDLSGDVYRLPKRPATIAVPGPYDAVMVRVVRQWTHADLDGRGWTEIPAIRADESSAEIRERLEIEAAYRTVNFKTGERAPSPTEIERLAAEVRKNRTPETFHSECFRENHDTAGPVVDAHLAGP